jgi:hypothetical protein
MLQDPLKDTHFTLDASGVAGFFGGDEAVMAMATVHVYEGRKWLGWFNSPGSYTVAKKYGQLANARFWRGLFPGVTVEPARLFELDGETGPSFRAMESGTVIANTGQTGFLFMKECENLEGKKVEGRKSRPVSVTIARLTKVPATVTSPQMAKSMQTWLASVPILASLCGAVFSGLFKDWYCFSMITLGSVVSGLSCYVIGCATLNFAHPTPSAGSPRGDGILRDDTGIAILLGEEGAVNSVTRGRFSLKFGSEPEYRNVGICSMLLILQFLAQLLLIPQGTLFGQIMFLMTLAVSWMYNSYLASLDREEIQRELLVRRVMGDPEMNKFELGTYTTAVVFATLAAKPSDPMKFLNHLIPNDTPVWIKWKTVMKGLLEEFIQHKNPDPEKFTFDDSHCDGIKDEKDLALLKNLYADSQSAYIGYLNKDHLPEGTEEV